jgi:hypothetical protein
MERALKAEEDGDDAQADCYIEMYAEAKGNAPTAKKAKPLTDPPRSANTTQSSGEPAKKQLVKQGGLTFVANQVNMFLDMGLPPYFNKNMKELKGLLPITIFNKRWQDAAMIHHSEKRQRASEATTDKDAYTGLRYPSEWEQTYSKWTINHRGFHQLLRDVYKFDEFAEWALVHKAHCNAIQAKDGFMAALRYDIHLRTNAFAHHVTDPKTEETSVPDKSEKREDIAEACFAEAQYYDELSF